MAPSINYLSLLFLACLLIMGTVASALEDRGVGLCLPERKRRPITTGLQETASVSVTLFISSTEKTTLMVVADRNLYARCNTTNPIQRFADGNTTVTFDSSFLFTAQVGIFNSDGAMLGENLHIRTMLKINL